MGAAPPVDDILPVEPAEPEGIPDAPPPEGLPGGGDAPKVPGGFP